MPQPRRPDYQPPQTLACHVARGESPEDGRRVTAIILPLNAETGGRGALPKSPSYRWRTVKGHCVEVLEAVCEEEYRWAFGSRGANFMGNETPLSLKNKKKDTTLYLLLQQKLQCWTLFSEWLGEAANKELCDLLKHHRVCGVSTLDFFTSSPLL